MPESRIFATKTFTKWQHKSGLTDQSLIHAVQEMRCGIVDAHLAKGLVKKRVAHPGRGKKGSSRTLVATRFEDRWFFIFGFMKNEKSNITAEEMQWLKDFSKRLLSLSNHELSMAMEAGELNEIKPNNA